MPEGYVQVVYDLEFFDLPDDVDEDDLIEMAFERIAADPSEGTIRRSRFYE